MDRKVGEPYLTLLFVLEVHLFHLLDPRVLFLVHPLWSSRLANRHCVGAEEREIDRRIAVYYYIALVGSLDLAPALALLQRCAREAAGVRPRISHLDEVVLPALLYLQYLIQCWPGLLEKVLGDPASKLETARPLALPEYRGRLGHVEYHVWKHALAFKQERQHVKADGRIAYCRHVDRHLVLIRLHKERLFRVFCLFFCGLAQRVGDVRGGRVLWNIFGALDLFLHNEVL